MAVHDLLVIGVVRIKDSHLALPEQQALALQIVVKILVFVGTDMVRCEIGKNTEIEQESLCPVQHKGLGGDLHDHRLHTRVRHVAECLLQKRGLRRRIVRRDLLVPVEDFDRTDEANLKSRSLQDRLDHVCGRRLSLGARHSDDLHLGSGISIICRRDISHRIAGILDADDHGILDRRLPFKVRQVQVLLHNERCRAVQKCLPCELMAVSHGADNAEEKAVFSDLAGIVHDLTDLGSAQRADSLGIRDHFPCQRIKMIIQFADQFLNLHLLSPTCVSDNP